MNKIIYVFLGAVFFAGLFASVEYAARLYFSISLAGGFVLWVILDENEELEKRVQKLEEENRELRKS